MLTRCFLWIFVVFSLLPAIKVAHADTAAVGTIVEVEGEATVTRAGKTYSAQVDTEVYLDDVISTGTQSRVLLLLVDDTEWTLSEKTKFKVTDFVFDPEDDTDNQARYSVLEGAFRYVSGLVAKKDVPDVDITTPFGSIGIRGTDFTGGPEEGGGYGVYVDEGSVNVANAAGETLLRHGEGASVRDRRSAPGRAQKWQRDRINQFKERVRLKRQDMVRQRLDQIKQARRGQLKQKMQEKMQERKQQIREKTQQRKQPMRRQRYNR